MEYTQYIIHIANELGFTPLNLILVVMLYFMGAQHGMFPKFWKGEPSPDRVPASKAQMDKLSTYYNHDTTEILRSIDLGVKKVHVAVENLEDIIKELKHNQSEMKEYGVKVRK